MDVEIYFKRINQSMIYAPFLAKCKQLIENCHKRGIDYYAISGYRSWPEQDTLYAKGRDKDGNVVNKALVVTNAKGGQSNHNYKVAIDFCKDKDKTREGLQPDWDAESYLVLAEEAEKLGLEAGYYWKFKDCPHIQLPLGKKSLSFSRLKDAYLNGGDKAMFKLLDQHKW